jgi:hypothetical protein
MSMPADQLHVAFLKKLIAAMLLGILATVLCVIIIDPYRLYALVDQNGFNHVKPALERYQEEIKLKAAIRLSPDTIIAGNSRAEIGFNPESKIFSENARSSYNLAIPGSGISSSLRQLNYLQAQNKSPQTLILGLDFLDFLVNPNLKEKARIAAKKMTDVDGYKWQFDAVFSLHSVADSLKTLQIQHKPEVETITIRGFNPLLEYNKYAREQGYYALFQQRSEENLKTYLRKRDYVIEPASDDRAHWAELRAIIQMASENGTRLNLVIYPYHAQILLMFEHLGLLPAFEQWKTQVAQEMENGRADHPKSKLKLWDFSGYGSFQCEMIPSKSDKMSVTKWYWEAGHFKPALGELMLSRMLQAPEQLASDSFGFLLNSANATANRRRFTEEKAACRKSYPELFEQIAHMPDGR